MSRYVELHATSHLSFLRGASSCEKVFSQAARCGLEAVAVVDRNSVAGIVRAHEAAKVTAPPSPCPTAGAASSRAGRVRPTRTTRRRRAWSRGTSSSPT